MFENAWWQKYTEEYYWVEVTKRDDIGENLRAPLKNTGSKDYFSYSILQQMCPKDLVIHYDGKISAITGISKVADSWVESPIDWIPSKKQKKGDKPNIIPGQMVKLSDYTNIRKVTLKQIQKKNNEIEYIIEDLKNRYNKAPYFPFGPASKKRNYLSTNEGYGFAVSQSFVDLFPKLKEALDKLRDGKKIKSQTDVPEKAPVNQDKEDAVEFYAFERAKKYYTKKGFDVEAMPRKGFPYDLKARKGDKELHIEVKGLSGKLEKIDLTWKEYEHCIKHPKNSVLFVVSEIKCMAPTNKRKKWKCSNGIIKEKNPWIINKSNLKPTTYSLTV